ncbi:alpha/beta fold hydrolase [Streptomyces rubiginosohelvolus]|uniref:AB hydrolase-1 domain-containing protein n=1 Tax=Streptomyces rubiginosohelvolus TaxID=67362 RepID=A0ABQ3C262_9ACTN|nr:hypothetical protein GCM10010328_44990 [Streptomyces pluricolorescens]
MAQGLPALTAEQAAQDRNAGPRAEPHRGLTSRRTSALGDVTAGTRRPARPAEFPAARVLRPGGTPPVLLAGLANNHRGWDGVRDDFHAVRNAHALDSRGTGEKGKPNKPYDTELFARNVVAVLDHLGVHRADVHGTSMGGRLARGSFVEWVQRIELAL